MINKQVIYLYKDKDGHEQGVSGPELLRLHSTGAIGDTTLVKQHGTQTEWRPFAEMKIAIPTRRLFRPKQVKQIQDSLPEKVPLCTNLGIALLALMLAPSGLLPLLIAKVPALLGVALAAEVNSQLLAGRTRHAFLFSRYALGLALASLIATGSLYFLTKR